MSEDEKLQLAAQWIENSHNIVVMSGAGISTAAGIPDFRSPRTGIYAAYQSGNLMHPEDVFSYDGFMRNPKGFFTAVRAILPDNIKPTTAHYFIRMLDDKKKLLRFCTQNVDGLEQLSGIPKSKIVEAHGTFATGHCISCRKQFPFKAMHEQIKRGDIPRCDTCKAVVKPEGLRFLNVKTEADFYLLRQMFGICHNCANYDVVLYGEALSSDFQDFVIRNVSNADLIIILGTSLKVYPFCHAYKMASTSCPIIVINKESLMSKISFLGMLPPSPKLYLEFVDACNDVALKIANQLNWKHDLESLVESEHRRLEQFKDIASLVEQHVEQ